MDIMIDLETLGTCPQALIKSIGLVAFDRDTGEIHKELLLYPDHAEQALDGRVADQATIEWWESQPEEIKNRLFNAETELLSKCAEKLNAFLEPYNKDDIKIWGNGSSTDCVWLETLLKNYHTPKMAFWQYRDVRTLVDLADAEDLKAEEKNKGTSHEAIEDCKQQIRYCVKALKRLKNAQ